jgi:hypothetical protein
MVNHALLLKGCGMVVTYCLRPERAGRAAEQYRVQNTRDGLAHRRCAQFHLRHAVLQQVTHRPKEQRERSPVPGACAPARAPRGAARVRGRAVPIILFVRAFVREFGSPLFSSTIVHCSMY